MSPPSDTDPPSKVAATVTRQPIILGSFRLTLALGASGFEWLTVLASAMTVMVMAGISRPFTNVNAVAARGLGGFAATRGSGDGVAGGVKGGAAAAGGKGGGGSAGVGVGPEGGTHWGVAGGGGRGA